MIPSVMTRLPWFKFYWIDWLSDSKIRRCSLAARGLLVEILCLMADGEERGRLITGRKPWSNDDIAKAIVGPTEIVPKLIEELLASKALERDRRGALMFPGMVHDASISAARSKAGAGNKTGTKDEQNPDKRRTKREQSPRVRASSSSSSSSSSELTPNSNSEFWMLIIGKLPAEFECKEFKRAWHEWETYRSKTKKKLSEFAVKKQAQMIVKEEWDVQRTIAAIDNSIRNDWQGLFEPPRPIGRQAPRGSQGSSQDGVPGAQRPARRGGEFADAPIRARSL